MKKSLFISIIIIAAIIGVTFYAVSELKKPSDAEGEAFGNAYNTRGVANCNAVATTTLDYKDDNEASSTCILMISDAKSADLLWLINASSTLTRIDYEVFFSQSDDLSSRDWYSYKGSSASTTEFSVWDASQYVERITNLSAGINYLTTSIEGLNSRWMKIEYATDASSSGINLKISPKNEID